MKNVIPPFTMQENLQQPTANLEKAIGYTPSSGLFYTNYEISTSQDENNFKISVSHLMYQK